MLGAVVLASSKGAYIGRPLADINKEKMAEIVETFLAEKAKTNEQKGMLSTKIGAFFYQEIDEVFLAVLGDATDTDVFGGMKVLEVGIRAAVKPHVSLETYQAEMCDVVHLIDEVFTKEGVVDRSTEDILRILSLHSNDELIHQMLVKNQEKEREKALKMRRRVPVIDELTKEIEEIKILKQTFRAAEHVPEKPAYRPKPAVSTRVRDFIECMDGRVNLITHQKLTSTVNSATETSKTEGTGELLVKITDEEYSLVEVDLKSKPGTSRAHPNVDKKAFAEGKIVPSKSLPTSAVWTLLRWAVEKPELPLEVSYWQNEVSEERYRFFIEVTARTPIQYVNIRVPTRRVSDIETENGSVEKEEITADIFDLEKGGSAALEFSGLCDNTDSLFPITILYTIEETGTLHPIEVSSVVLQEDSAKVEPEHILLGKIIEGKCTVLGE
ncbi:hypothetical protein NECID01_0424 [Nematocida sp. AWRm77]|nr:hypothetical protein NECID01_0424 [Nematocida sp. AWRm77]